MTNNNLLYLAWVLESSLPCTVVQKLKKTATQKEVLMSPDNQCLYLHLNWHGFDLQYVLPCASRVDPDSTLHRDLMQLKGQEGTDHVLLNMTFTVSEVIH